MVDHAAHSAFPDGSTIDKGVTRSLLVDRYGYVLTSADESQSLDADVNGTAIQCLIYNGWVFARDDTDAITAHDGVTCLVTNDGKRFKKEDVGFPYSVLDILNATPGSPAAGDAYIVDTAPTGQWATDSAAEKIAVYTARGWVYIEPSIGMPIFVEDVEQFYHYNVAGNWVQGIDDGSGLADNSVYPNQLLFPTGIPSVENQTTTTPPAIPAAGTAYIIGSGATGDWAGYDDYLAVSNGTEWKYHAPADGYQVYDKSLDGYYKYEDSTWTTAIAAGKVVDYKYFYKPTSDGADTIDGTNGTSTANFTSSPSNDVGERIKRRTHTLANASNLLAIWVDVELEDDGLGIALFVDTETAARVWRFSTVTTDEKTLSFHIILAPGDTSSHNYDLRVWGNSATTDYRGYTFTIQELAA